MESDRECRRGGSDIHQPCARTARSPRCPRRGSRVTLRPDDETSPAQRACQGHDRFSDGRRARRAGEASSRDASDDSSVRDRRGGEDNCSTRYIRLARRWPTQSERTSRSWHLWCSTVRPTLRLARATSRLSGEHSYMAWVGCPQCAKTINEYDVVCKACGWDKYAGSMTQTPKPATRQR